MEKNSAMIDNSFRGKEKGFNGGKKLFYIRVKQVYILVL